QGVLGIVASRISELVEKPVFILTAENDQIKGSGRAPEGFDLHSMLQALEGYLERFGGHAQAAGISLQSDKLEAFKQEFSELCTLSGLSQVKQLEIDLDIDIDTDLNSLYNNFKILEPMGQGNEEPVLIIRSAQILQTKAISSGAHLQVNFLFGNRRYQAFAWRQGHFLQDFLGLLDLVIKLQTNVYRGVESLRIEILDWRQATLLNLSQLQEIRERGDSSSFYFYSPESLEILNESGIMGKDDLQLAINQEFPFLPLGQYWPSSENLEVYQLDLPLSTEVSGQSLFDQSQVLNFKQMLNWLLPDREHLAIWYRWLKGEGLNLKAYDTYLYPGGLNDFYAEIALSNVLHLFLQAGLIELRENDFFWLETSGKIDLHSLDEFKIMEKKRENLQNLLG
ncbi:MAG: hypothetical protein GX138_06615, partial [Firmicutes bacterium]|nr:hypothetical protein [Bacillota bacterium]